MYSDKPDSLYDSRIIERNIAAGLVTRADYEAWLASLEDDASKCVETTTQFIRGQTNMAESDED